tara:strand:+ start:303 stop:932 length:630 start_codon:yes stop_codon:yes gene_type:complete
MNKLIFIICIFCCTLVSGCKTEITDKDNTSLIIENFNLSHYSKNGNKVYTLVTPYSVFNKLNQTYRLKENNIRFYELNKVKYIVNSDSAQVLNDNKLILLKGNINISDINDDITTIKSNNLTWNIDKSEFKLEGNVYLINNIIKLNSSKAILDKNTNIITFYKPVKYSYSDINSTTKYYIESENAYYDLVNKNVLFKSKRDNVKTRIVF